MKNKAVIHRTSRLKLVDGNSTGWDFALNKQGLIYIRHLDGGGHFTGTAIAGYLWQDDGVLPLTMMEAAHWLKGMALDEITRPTEELITVGEMAQGQFAEYRDVPRGRVVLCVDKGKEYAVFMPDGGFRITAGPNLANLVWPLGTGDRLEITEVDTEGELRDDCQCVHD